MTITDALVAHWGLPDRNARFATGSTLVEVLKYNAESPDAKTARHWLERLTADGKIRQ